MTHAAHPRPAAGEAGRPPALVTRRRVLLSTAGVVVAAGGGVATAALRSLPQPPQPPQPPAVLVDALVAERVLLASIAASAAAQPELAQVLNQLARDHRAHAQALAATLVAYPGAAESATAPPGSARSAAALRGAEQQAAAAAAGRARTLSGTAATLLASIAACEASHAELLT